MPNFFFISESGDGLFLARRLETEGHRIRFYVKDPKGQNLYRGILRNPAVKRPDPERGEIVIFDMVRFGSKADSLRRSGYKVIGASGFADAIEVSRPIGSDVMRKIGVRTPETHVFKRLTDGQKYLRNAKGVWYYKPSGNLDTAMTECGEPDYLIRYLEWTKREPPNEFILQKSMTEGGTEISLEGWFDGKRFVWPFNSTVEDKKLMNDGIGPRTGCAANVVWAYEESRPTLASKTVARLEPLLEAAGHSGPIDMNMMLDDQGEPHGLEWSPRFGYDALQALAAITEGDLGHQLADFANQRLEGFSTRTDAYGMTLRLSVPPYPNYAHARLDASELPLDPRLLKDTGTYLNDAMVGSNGLMLTGCDGSVACLVEVGHELEPLRTKLVKRAKEYKVAGLQYRTDPVRRTESVLAALKGFAYDKPNVRVVEEESRPPRKAQFDFGSEAAPAKRGSNFAKQPKVAIPVEAPVNWDQPTYK